MYQYCCFYEILFKKNYVGNDPVVYLRIGIYFTYESSIERIYITRFGGLEPGLIYLYDGVLVPLYVPVVKIKRVLCRLVGAGFKTGFYFFFHIGLAGIKTRFKTGLFN